MLTTMGTWTCVIQTGLLEQLLRCWVTGMATLHFHRQFPYYRRYNEIDKFHEIHSVPLNRSSDYRYGSSSKYINVGRRAVVDQENLREQVYSSDGGCARRSGPIFLFLGG